MKKPLPMLPVLMLSVFSCSSDDHNAAPSATQGPNSDTLPATSPATDATSDSENIPAFAPANSDALEAVYRSDIALEDVDGDGDRDLMVTGSTLTNAISELYLNDGVGNFTRVLDANIVPVTDASISLDDVDADGDPDLFLAGTNNTDTIATLYINDGSGLFTEVTDHNVVPLLAVSLDTGDVDEDGSADLVMSGYSNDQYKVVLYKNNGSGAFTAIELASYDSPTVKNQTVELADLDQDGDLDIAFLFFHADGQSTQTYKVVTLQNDGSGVYSPLTEINADNGFVSQRYCNMTLADFDLDGDLDTFLGCDFTSFRHWAGSSRLLLNDGQGGFTQSENISFPTMSSDFCHSDINADTIADILAVGGVHDLAGIYIGSDIPSAILYQSNAQNGYEPEDSGTLNGIIEGSCAIGDVNGDNVSDVILTGLVSSSADPSVADKLSIDVYLNNILVE